MADERFSKGSEDRSRRFMGPHYWIRVIAGREMPVFATTVRRVAAVTSRVWSSSGEAARVIAMDPVMTARVIRMANSAYYNPGLRSVGVLSRAVAVIGFDALRQLCRATEVVEQVCEGFRRRQIERETARSFLGAVFAQRLAESRYEEYPEEVFTAALLSRLG
ncbi:MAG: HDOD domain-containing protein, partial [Thermodesulfobacteriota bacterium]|nr:HDOD domain-containing protein [Thermodesulfobacteriota bacterium]